MITCVILYIFGSNFGATIIVGFASNLFIGVALSLFTAVVVTRNFLNLLVPTGIATHPALYGLPASALNVARYNPSRVRAAANAATAASRLRRASAADASEGGPNGASNGSRPAVGAARTTSGRQEVEE
jgi:hypothetical protein